MRIRLTLILSLLLILSPAALAQTVDQRLAALEQRVSAVETKVGVEPAPAPVIVPANALPLTIVKPISHWHAVHLQLDEATAKTLPIVQWVSDLGVERRGFDAAFTAEDGVVVVQTVNGKAMQAYRIDWPGAPPAMAVAIGTDLSKLKKGSAYALAAGSYSLSGGYNDFTDTTFLGVGHEQTVVNYTGPQVKARGWAGAVVTGDRLVIRGVAFNNATYTYDHALPYGKNGARQDSVHFCAPGTDSAFIDVRVDNFNDGFNSNNRPSRVLIRACIGVDSIGCFVWNEANQLCLYDCTANNSRIEHIARGQSWTYWSINGCSFTNLDHRNDADPATRDVNDDGKGTVVMQNGDYGYTWNCTLIGPEGMGPLATGQNGKSDVYTRWMVWDLQASTDHALDLHPGLDTFRVLGGAVNFLSDDNRGIKNGTLPKGASVPSRADVVNVKAAA